MLVKIILNFIVGYVRIKVESTYIERFLNLCKSRKIFLWGMKREKIETLYTNISISEYKRLREISKNRDLKIKIEAKKGLPFFMHKYRKRKFFIIMLFIMIVTIISLSQFIWNIEIICDEEVNKSEILEQLDEAGLKIGGLKTKVNSNELINKIRLVRDDISWMGVDIKGTNVVVEIILRTEKPDIVDQDEYCNIVANKTGIITKINVQNGMANVTEGEIVKEGEILVNGYMEGKYTGIRYVHSMAEIEAKVWYSKKEKFTYNQKIKKSSGATETKYRLKFNNFIINFYKTLSKFEKYDTIEEVKKFNLFSNFYLPIEIVKISNYEYNENEIEYTEQELTEIAKKKIESELTKQFDINKIINEQINVYNVDDGIEVEIIYEVLEEIGTEEKIVF